MNADKKVWLITGCSTGFGRALTEEVLASGDNVVVTARNIADIQDFAKNFPDTTLLQTLDITKPQQIMAVVAALNAKFGRIDVLVNNAGYGVVGAIEEVPDSEVRQLFETNFFGLLNMTRAILPMMRAQKSGYIINMASVAGLVSTPGFGIYNATKFAVEGLTEALAQEVEPLGIKVTSIEPGPFRTQFASRSIHKFSGITEYDQTRGMFNQVLEQYDGKQPGDPKKAALAIIKLAQHPVPPLHLLMGQLALERVREKIANLNDNITEWQEVTTEVDFNK